MPATATAISADAPRLRRRTKADRFDRRSVHWRRRCELIAAYIDALEGAQVTATLALRIEAAAEMRCCAERARADYLNTGRTSVDDVVRSERAASHAERSLGIGQAKAKPSALGLEEYLAGKDRVRA